MEAEREVVGGVLLGGVEIADLVVAAADDVVVADDDAGDGGEEDGVGGEVGCEIVRGGEKVPVFIRGSRNGLEGGLAYHGHMTRPTVAQM